MISVLSDVQVSLFTAEDQGHMHVLSSQSVNDMTMRCAVV